MIYKARIEIPQGSMYKYEFDKGTRQLMIDRPINQDIPHNYGYIPETLEKDGDPIDVFVIASGPLVPGSYCWIEVLSGIKCIDNGLEDNKIIAKIKGDDIKYRRIALNEILLYLKTYKKGFKVIEEVNQLEAVKMIEEAKSLYTNTDGIYS